MPQLSEKHKYEIIFRHDINKESMRNISKNMNINRLTISKWIKKYNLDNNFDRLSGSGRKKVCPKKQN
jgi:transposase